VIDAVPAAFKTIVWLPATPVTVYVTVAFGVPVKVTVALFPVQIVVDAAMLTTGNVMTEIVIVPLSGCVHPGAPAEVTLTSVNVVVAVYEPVTEAFPAAFRTIVWLAATPETVYVTVAFGVPVKVTVAFPPEQIVTLDAIEAVGNG
jgi:hypothetical protein